MSNLNYGAIDETFPVAGQDNNSQGFRGNFSAIKTSLATAQTDITALENTSAKLDDTNNFLGNKIYNAEVSQLFGSVYSQGPITSPAFVDVTSGPFHVVTFGANTTITFRGWPDDHHASIRVHLVGDGSNDRTPTFATVGGGQVVLEDSFPSLTGLLTDAGEHHVIEAWTYNYDNYKKVFVRYLGSFAPSA